MIRKMLVIAALLLCGAAYASADDFTFNFTGILGDTDTVSGTLITTPLGGGQFKITGITDGMVDGVAIVGFLPDVGDDLLFIPADPGYLDPAGFGFVDANGTDFVLAEQTDDHGEPPVYFLYLPLSISFGDLTVTPVGQVPEPGSFALLATGLLGAAGALRRRFAA